MPSSIPRYLVAATVLLMMAGRLDTLRLRLPSGLDWSLGYTLYGLAFGCLQDVAVLVQLYFLICLRPRWAPFFLIVYSLPIVLDLALQHWGYPRLSYSDVKLVFSNFRQFVTSFEQVFYEFSTLVVIVIYVAAITSSSKYLLSSSPAGSFQIYVAALSGLFATNFVLLLRYIHSSQTRYQFDNAVVSIQAGLLTDLGIYRSVSSPAKFISAPSPILSSILGDTENYTLASQKHPFWRQTHGYVGAVRFHIAPANRSYNILILNMESWAHHVVGCLTDQSASLTPEFDDLAKGGILFRSHYSPSSQTSRSLLTHLFGIKPKFDHEAALATQSQSLCVYGLADVLKARGYRNEFVSGTDLNWHDWEWFLAHHGFDQCHDRNDIAENLKRLGFASDQYEQQSWGLHDQQTMMSLEDRIEQLHNGSQPFFVDYYSVSSHSPFLVPSEALSGRDRNHPAVLASRGKTSRNYKTSIIYSDRLLGRLIRSLRKKGLLNDTITIIQGDHGRGKDYRLGGNPELHMVELLDDFQRVPLLILPPYAQDAQTIRVDEVSSQYDIMATILDMIGLYPFYQHGIGQSLMRQLPLNRHIFLDNPINGFKLYAAVTNQFKYVFNIMREEVCIYARVSDPDEVAPECIPYTDLASRSILKEVKHLCDSLQAMVDTSYGKNQFFPCKNNTVSIISYLLYVSSI